MRSLIPPELTLDCGGASPETRVPTTTGNFLVGISSIQNSPEKISKLEDYVSRLDDEMKKIDAFKRELPLCMLLLNDGEFLFLLQFPHFTPHRNFFFSIAAIAKIKEELIQCRNSITEPIIEEFIPLKKSLPKKEDDKIDSVDKMNWMSSVQLWNSDNHPNTENKKKWGGVDLIKSGNNRTEGRAFSSFKRCADLPALSLATPEIKNSKKEEICSSDFSPKSSSSRSGSSSATNTDQSNSKSKLPNQTSRKQRRCWSPELHRRFISALEHLGGPQSATPKQIRDLMQVHGLTNDEVKSHLQKYRLLARKLAPKTNTLVGIGSLWMPQQQKESSKKSNSQFGSPVGPLLLASSSRVSSIVEEDDEKSEL
ncbi:hypothetical protein ABFX02_14G113200 [Erythranthe guttata]